MRPIVRQLLIQTNVVAVPAAAGQQVFFPDIPELRSGVRVLGIEAYTSTQLAQTISLNPVISAVDATRCVVTFQEKSTQRLQDFPYVSLVSQTQAGIWKEVVPFLPNWQASFIQFTVAPAAAVNFVAAFSIFYERLRMRA